MKFVGFSSSCLLSVSRAFKLSQCMNTPRRHCAAPSRRRPRETMTNTSAGFPAPNVAGLARDIALSFVTACASTTVPYSIAVRKFVSLSLEAYSRGISLSALRLELRSDGLTPRPLANDEAELRDVWLALVYKTLRAVRYPSGTPSPITVPDQFDAFVKSVVAARRDGSDLPRIQLEHAVTSGAERNSALESAILRQSTRLVVATLEEADERRKKANQDVTIDEL